jgi:hypothetical protein
MNHPVYFFDVVEAVRTAIHAADPEKRKALATAMECFSHDEPDTFRWAIGPQCPSFLRDLIYAICIASEEKTKPRDNVIHLVRKTNGSPTQ